EVRAVLGEHPGVSIAGLNGPTSTVVSGDEQPTLELAKHFETHGRKVSRLAVSHAFHSQYMEPMLEGFRKVAESLDFHAPKVQIVSNVTGTFATAEELRSAGYWARHIREAVRFVDDVRTLENAGAGTFLELGPHGVLSSMAASSLEDATRNCAFISVL